MELVYVNNVSHIHSLVLLSEDDICSHALLTCDRYSHRTQSYDLKSDASKELRQKKEGKKEIK